MIYKNNYDNHAIIMLLFPGHSKQGWKCKFCKLNFHNGCKNKVNYTLIKNFILDRILFSFALQLWKRLYLAISYLVNWMDIKCQLQVSRCQAITKSKQFKKHFSTSDFSERLNIGNQSKRSCSSGGSYNLKLLKEWSHPEVVHPP